MAIPIIYVMAARAMIIARVGIIIDRAWVSRKRRIGIDLQPDAGRAGNGPPHSESEVDVGTSIHEPLGFLGTSLGDTQTRQSYRVLIWSPPELKVFIAVAWLLQPADGEVLQIVHFLHRRVRIAAIDHVCANKISRARADERVEIFYIIAVQPVQIITVIPERAGDV